MQTSIMLSFGLVVFAMIASESFAGEDKTPKRVFPEVSAPDLNRQEHKFPKDFEGSRNLAVVAFEREQQKEVDTWLEHLAEYQKLDAKLRGFEFPVISSNMNLIKPFVDNGMRAGIPDKSIRARTISLYLDKKEFKKSLGIDSEKVVSVFLLDGEGKVLWSSTGPYTAEKAAGLEAILKEKTDK